MKYFICIIVVGLLFFGCEKPPSYSNMPVITSISLTPTVIRSYINSDSDAQGLPDTVQVQIGFTDGNGLLGSPSSDSNVVNAFLVDSRTTPSGQPTIDSFSIPYITPSGNVKAISGTISLTVLDIIGRLDPTHTAWDTLHFTATIVDRNGKISNAVVTPNLYIKDN